MSDPNLVTCLPNAALGGPLLIGKFDDEVAEYIRNLRLSGGAAVKGIIAHRNSDYGGKTMVEP